MGRCKDCVNKGEIGPYLGCKVLGIRRDWNTDRDCVGFVPDFEMPDTSTAPTADTPLREAT